MTLPLHLVAPQALDGAEVGAMVRLDGPEGRHAVTVRRARVGELLLVSDGQGRSAEGEVVAVGDAVLDLRLLTLLSEPEQSPRFVLVQALAKGGRDDQAIEAATECGVDEVVPWQASRSIVQWRGERGEKARRGWDSVLVAATKQSRRTRRPVLGPTSTTSDVAGRAGRAAAAFVLHEDAGMPLADIALPAAGDVLVVVGPEGGISPEELAVLEAAGAQPVRLGRTVLRSSSAGPAALAVLSAMARWR